MVVFSKPCPRPYTLSTSARTKPRPLPCPPLYSAAEQGHTSILRLLLAHRDVDVNQRWLLSRTALHTASDRGHTRCVEALVERTECRVDVRDSGGCTPLYLAATQGHQDIVWQLITRGANLNTSPHGKSSLTPVLSAAHYKHYATVELLICAGACINPQLIPASPDLIPSSPYLIPPSPDIIPSSPYLIPTSPDRIPSSPYLIATYPYPNLSPCYPAPSALIMNTSTCRFVTTAPYSLSPLSKQSKVRCRGCKKRRRLNCPHLQEPPSASTTPSLLHLAVCESLGRVVLLCLVAGCPPDTPHPTTGDTPLCVAARRGDSPLLALLIQWGARIEARGEYGNTALYEAARGGHEQCVKTLLFRGGERLVRQAAYLEQTKTPLYGAAYGCGKVEVKMNIIRILLGSGFRLDHERWYLEGRIPSDLSAEVHFLQWLREAGRGPPPLSQLCRGEVRKQVGRYYSVMSALPRALQDYILIN